VLGEQAEAERVAVLVIPDVGEDDDLDARGTGGTLGTPMNRNGDRRAPGVAGLGVREPRSSLYRRLEGAIT